MQTAAARDAALCRPREDAQCKFSDDTIASNSGADASKNVPGGPFEPHEMQLSIHNAHDATTLSWQPVAWNIGVVHLDRRLASEASRLGGISGTLRNSVPG
jgi:hypothetical protein